MLEVHLTPTVALPKLHLWLGLHLLREERVLKVRDSVNRTALKSLQASLFEDTSFLSIYLSICPSITYLSIYLSIYIYIYLIYLSIYLPTHLSVHLSPNTLLHSQHVSTNDAVKQVSHNKART